ncbi:MAG: DNA polymerase IV [Kaiparowitsia implicata GSE-PSE-MK54-09C]|jgi:DNA polymerase-4|nr:DNA polymerase IV [Kaiparowitsia implicata GSE-PSE-MK54-09C]
MRKIIHVDMDAFYASVEQRDRPECRGKPVAVGGSPDKRGAVAAASYEARQFGVHSAMPSRTAVQKCPHLIFVQPRFEVYGAVSQQIRDIFYRYTDLVEPLALDEAYLDVTEQAGDDPSQDSFVELQSRRSATAIAHAIKADILAETQLTASAGVSINKFLAKIASGMDKPDGLYLIRPEAAEAFVANLPIEKFHGVGEVTAAKMHRLGIQTGADLKEWAEVDLVAAFGKVGRHYYRIARAIDDRLVEPNRMRKSIGVETSFADDVCDRPAMHQALEQIATELQQRMADKDTSGRTLTLKVKYADYQQVTRSRTLPEAIATTAQILPLATALLDTLLDSVGDTPLRPQKPVRLLGLAIANLTISAPSTPSDRASHPIYQQLTLF